MQIIIYTCVLCDTPVRPMHRFCSKHFMEYGENTNEEWLLFLLDQQRQQRNIDRHECYSLERDTIVGIEGLIEKKEFIAKKDVGRPSTHWKVVNQVLDIYDASVEACHAGIIPRRKSLRAIARELDNKIGYCTVRNILKTYRK